MLALCRQPGKIAILTHTNPDGDGLPASLALQIILKHAGFSSDIILEDTAPDSLDFLKAKDKTLLFQEDMEYQIIIILDCHEPERTGKCSILTKKASVLIAVDHHQPQELNKNWYYYIKPEDVSAGAILFNTFRSDISRFYPDERRYVTDCIYTTILNDTDGFINHNTNAEVFRICASLVEMGTLPYQIIEEFILSNSPDKLRFVGNALSSIQTFNVNKILFMFTTLEQLSQNSLPPEATSKITKWVKGSIGMDVFIYARELAENSYRLSLRSPVVNCNQICGTFGGGGHTAAAGCEINAPFDEMKDLIISEVKKHLNE